MAGNEDYINGIRVFRNLKNEVVVVSINSSDLKKSIEVAQNLKCSKISLSGEYEINDINFLNSSDLSFVTDIAISKPIVDWLPLYNIGHQIISFTYSPENLVIDLANFDSLEFIGCCWSQNISNLSKCINLKGIKFRKFSELDLNIFSALSNLSYLELNSSKLQTLLGIENCIHLKVLDLDSNRNLISLEGLNKCHERLEDIRIFGAPKLQDASQIGELPDLKRIHLGRIKSLKSLKFLDEIKKLEFCVINPKNVGVLDSDYSPLYKLKERSCL